MAGVSPAVVSYVINGGPRPVSAETRARVESCIAALNYRPNGVASALRRGAARSLGMLMPSPINPYFAELADAVKGEVNEAGYSLSIGITHDEDPVREPYRSVDSVCRDGKRSRTSSGRRARPPSSATPPSQPGVARPLLVRCWTRPFPPDRLTT